MKIFEIEGNVRKLIMEEVQSTMNPSYLEFYNNGEMHKQVKKETSARIVSIFDNPKITRELMGNPDTYYGDLKIFCENNRARNDFNIIWLDYHLRYNSAIEEDLQTLLLIMKEKGTLYITLLDEKEFKKEDDPGGKFSEAAMFYMICEYFAKRGIEVNMECKIKDLNASTWKEREKLATYKFTWVKREGVLEVFITLEGIVGTKIKK